jgi:large subunit ribosomal protein L15
MPLQRRVPKFGFTNPNRVEYKGINLDTLQALVDDKKVKAIDQELLAANGLVQKNELVKILGRGELTAKIDVIAHAYSASAKAAIEGNGGKADLVAGIDKVPAKAAKSIAPAANKEVPATKVEDKGTTEEE